MLGKEKVVIPKEERAQRLFVSLGTPRCGLVLDFFFSGKRPPAAPRTPVMVEDVRKSSP